MAAKAKKPNKISKAELETLTKLQKEITNILAQIGNAEVVKSQLLTKHVQVQEEWTANANTLEEKYGKVNVDLATGNVVIKIGQTVLVTGEELALATDTVDVISWNPIIPGATGVWIPIDPDNP